MATTSHGVAGVTFDAKKRVLPPEAGVFLALILIVAVFEVLNRLNGGSFLFNTRANVSSLFNDQRINIMLLQVAITGIIAIGVTQVIIIGGIDLSSGPKIAFGFGLPLTIAVCAKLMAIIAVAPTTEPEERSMPPMMMT